MEIGMELQAFTPDGVLVKRGLHASTGKFDIASFSLAEGGKVQATRDDGCFDDVGDPVEIQGEAIYVDEWGRWWLERTLTYKAKDGNVVRQGNDGPQLPKILVSEAVEREIGLKLLQMKSASPLSESDWVDTVNKQGWDDRSEILHLEGFIRAMGLMPAFAAYAQMAAAEENGEVEAAC